VPKKSERDIEKIYSTRQFVTKLRRLANALEQGKRFSIQVAGKRVYIPAKAAMKSTSLSKKYLAAATALLFFSIALILQIFLALQIWDSGALSFYIGDTLLRMDALAVFFALIALVLGTIVCLFSTMYMKNDKGQEYYYTLLLLMVAGIIGIGLATDLLVLYLFFELMSIPSFALVAFRRNEWMAIEAGMKYSCT
jgi:formate hydrogenlyase subunit 3/multisubunit Na+/H+ antiporter MnhD subunit